MPMIYTCSLATPGVLTTSGTPNTETDAWTLKPGSSRSAYFQAMYVVGRGAGLTAISGIAFRLCTFGTASTAGTAMTPTPKDPGMQAAKASAASRPTAGATRTNRVIFGCGAAGPGGYVAPNEDSTEVLAAGAAGSLDCMDVSGTASLSYEFSFEFQE